MSALRRSLLCWLCWTGPRANEGTLWTCLRWNRRLNSENMKLLFFCFIQFIVNQQLSSEIFFIIFIFFSKLWKVNLTSRNSRWWYSPSQLSNLFKDSREKNKFQLIKNYAVKFFLRKEILSFRRIWWLWHNLLNQSTSLFVYAICKMFISKLHFYYVSLFKVIKRLPSEFFAIMNDPQQFFWKKPLRTPSNTLIFNPYQSMQKSKKKLENNLS